MSKNLEREYRALVNSEVPDLWARIEAGLEDKKTTPEKEETRGNVRGKKVNLKMWAGLAAACVCVALIVPAMARMMTMGGSGSGYSNSAPQMEDSYEKTDDAGQEAAYEESVNNAAANENGASSSTITSYNVNTNSSADAVNIASGGLEEAAAEEQGAYIFRATVEILDMEDQMDNGIQYTAKVITTENPDIQVDSRIKFVSSAVEGAKTMEKSQTYEITLYEDDFENADQERTYILVNDALE